MRTEAIILVLLALVPLRALAQGERSADGTDLLLGLAPGATMRWHTGELRTCPEADCLPFTEGSGAGFSVAFRAYVPLGEAVFLRAGLGWEDAQGEFSVTRHNYPILGQGNTVEYVDLEDELRVDFSALNLDLTLAYRIAGSDVFVAAGPVLTVPISPQWTQTESITAPPGVQYADGGSSKVLLDGAVPGTQPFIALRVGGGGLFPLADALSLFPELSYDIPLSDLQPDFSWSTSCLGISVAVLLRL